jgi:hypothetical protein
MSDELINLQIQDDELNNKFINSLDKLIYDSIYEKNINKYLNNETELDLDLEIQNKLDNLNLTNIPLNHDLDNLEKYLQNMVKIRNDVWKSKITDYSKVPDDLIFINNNLIKQNLELVNNYSDIIKELYSLKIENKLKFDEFFELIKSIKDLKQHKKNNNHDNYDDDNDDDDKSEVEILKLKHKKLLGKNLMLSNFVTDLINSINSTSISNDEKLLEMLLDCGNYNL